MDKGVSEHPSGSLGFPSDPSFEGILVRFFGARWVVVVSFGCVLAERSGARGFVSDPKPANSCFGEGAVVNPLVVPLTF